MGFWLIFTRKIIFSRQSQNFFQTIFCAGSEKVFATPWKCMSFPVFRMFSHSHLLMKQTHLIYLFCKVWALFTSSWGFFIPFSHRDVDIGPLVCEGCFFPSSFTLDSLNFRFYYIYNTTFWDSSSPNWILLMKFLFFQIDPPSKSLYLFLIQIVIFLFQISPVFWDCSRRWRVSFQPSSSSSPPVLGGFSEKKREKILKKRK